VATAQTTRNIVVGVTGASGSAYARRLVQCLARGGVHVHLVVSPFGQQVAADELGLKPFSLEAFVGGVADGVTLHPHRNLGAPIASGSFPTDGMIVCPCSVHTLGAVASGVSDNLVARAAAVTLKEGRRLVLVPREMPLSPIDLENALRASRAGAIICPAAPGFYMRPQRVEDLIDFVVGRLLDLVNVPHTLNTRWADRLAEGDPT
jgi:4-hydroxy-3-polyprenylbenzoate decarboxylase